MSYFVSFTIFGKLNESDVEEIRSQAKEVNANYVWQSQDISFTSKFDKRFPKNLPEEAVIYGKSNVEDSIADISYIIEFWQEVSKKHPQLEIKLDYNEDISSKLPRNITAGNITPADWNPLKKERSAIEVEVDPILWDWWKGQEESTDAQALNDVMTLFIDNFYEAEFRVFNPKKTLNIKACIPQITLDKCSEYIHKYGISTFINSCLAWARLEEEKLKARFSSTMDNGESKPLF
ncbi:MAG: hypothetical protein JG764_349 [Clostridiales bacterium]|nr:hypothetical protein [Clostridiales bacterium]